MDRVYLTWHDVEELITKVVMQLNTPYDALLLITRGGIVPGGMIAEALNMKDLLTASILFQHGPGVRAEMSWPHFQQFPADALLNGKKILIVDNIWDRGRTIVTVKSRGAAPLPKPRGSTGSSGRAASKTRSRTTTPN